MSSGTLPVAAYTIVSRGLKRERAALPIRVYSGIAVPLTRPGLEVMSCQTHVPGVVKDRTGEHSARADRDPVKNPIRIHRKEGEDRKKKRQNDEEGEKHPKTQDHQERQHHEDGAFLGDGDQPMGRDEEQKDRSVLSPSPGKSEERLAEGVHDHIGGSDDFNIRL